MIGSKEKTILFIMPRLPFPATSGRKTSLYHYCRIFSQELGFRLVVAAFLEDGDQPDQKPEFIDRLVILPKASGKTKILNVLKDSLILKRKPMQVSLYWNLEAKRIINQLMEEEKPEIVIGDMVRSTEYIKDLQAYRIADLDDRISLRYQRQLENDIQGINPYGAYLNTIPKFLRCIMLFKPIKVYVVKNEISLLKKYEIEMSKICESTVFVARSEAEQMNRELGKVKSIAVPIGVDIDYFNYRNIENSTNYIGFLGAMSVAHNENAVRYFIDKILPLIIKEKPNVKFLVIGGGASKSLMNLTSSNVEFTGRVDDVREWLEKCKVFVCPMTFGSGIKTKNLEAMAMGLPVVTTSVGAENINAIDGKEWIIADEPEKFAEAVCTLLDDEEKRLEMSINCRNLIAKEWTWEVARKALNDLLKMRS